MIKETDKPGLASTPSYSPGRDFLLAAANMSWQLAIIVLVPIVGGFQLDKMLDSLPAFTALGFIVAMAGMTYIVWRQLQLFQPPPAKKSKGIKR